MTKKPTKIILPEGLPTIREIYGKDFEKGKIRISWSQSRAGYVTFLSGRMIGESFDTPEDAQQWLREEVGVTREIQITQ